MSLTAFLIGFVCAIAVPAVVYHTVHVSNKAIFLPIGVLGPVLIIVALVCDALGIGKLPSWPLALLLLIGLAAFGYGMGGAMRAWLRASLKAGTWP